MQQYRQRLMILFLLLMGIMLGGCALQYYDPVTQTDHLWGFGHFKMKVAPPNEGVQAVVKGATVVGASFKIAPDDKHVVIGLDRTSQMTVVSEDASVRFEGPANDLFSVRVGSRPPFLSANPEADSQGTPIRKGEE